MPADKLVIRDVIDFKADAPKRGALRIAKLKHGGDWNIAPQAIPNLMEVLRKPPLSFDVVINQKDLLPRDPELDLLPARLHPRPRGVVVRQRRPRGAAQHLDPGGGTLFADAACGSPTFDGVVSEVRRSASAEQPARPDSAHRRALRNQGGLRPHGRPLYGRSRRCPRFSAARRESRSTTTGRSSIPSTTSAAHWSGTPAWNARVTFTRARSRSLPTS